MKTVGFRSFVLYILLAVFLAGVGYLSVELLLNGGKWSMQPYNGHLYGEGETTAVRGEITDRNGNVLAYTDENGQRLYGYGETNRRALLHTVGDPWGYISTGAEHTMSARLSGYNFLTGLNPLPFSLGKNVRLTVDQAACAAAYTAMGGKNGAVFVYNYKTGEVLCKVSAPGFDPEHPPEDLTENEEAYKGVYLDNTLSGAFTPGSIFKLVTAMAAMEKWPESWLSRTYTCSGSQEVGGSEIRCLHGDAHGEQDLPAALGNSCNVYFSQLAVDIGPEALTKKAEEMGFNREFVFSGIPLAESEIDLSAANINQLGWAGVGQYTVLANPCHMAVLMGAIASGGEAVEPRTTPGAAASAGRLVSAEEAAALRDLMRGTVADYYGEWNFPEGLNVCAKTGTGEVGEGKDPNCWIVGFCDDSAHPYAFAVLVEEGSGGLETAGSVASAALQALM